MAGASLLTLIDDIATLLDDVAVMSKLAVKKTAGVLGDDLALNADQVSGVNPDRELPVVWAVAKGSLINKVILVPAALAISAFIPWALTPLLMIGGTYLCFEGFEKIAHRFLHDEHEEAEHRAELAQAMEDPTIDLVAVEKQKIRGAIRTDFILSAEIVVIALATMAHASLVMQAVTLSAVGLLITVGVYGLVAAIVKLDDLGLYLVAGEQESARGIRQRVGRGLLGFTPYLMRALSMAGMVAMFLVGGGILTHNIPPLHHAVEHWVEGLHEHGGAASVLLANVAPLAIDLVAGLVVGAIAVAVVEGVRRLIKSTRPAPRPS